MGKIGVKNVTRGGISGLVVTWNGEGIEDTFVGADNVEEYEAISGLEKRAKDVEGRSRFIVREESVGGKQRYVLVAVHPTNDNDQTDIYYWTPTADEVSADPNFPGLGGKLASDLEEASGQTILLLPKDHQFTGDAIGAGDTGSGRSRFRAPRFFGGGGGGDSRTDTAPTPTAVDTGAQKPAAGAAGGSTSEVDTSGPSIISGVTLDEFNAMGPFEQMNAFYFQQLEIAQARNISNPSAHATRLVNQAVLEGELRFGMTVPPEFDKPNPMQVASDGLREDIAWHTEGGIKVYTKARAVLSSIIAGLSPDAGMRVYERMRDSGAISEIIGQARQATQSEAYANRQTTFTTFWKNSVTNDLKAQISSPDAYRLSSDELASLKMTLSRANAALPQMFAQYDAWYQEKVSQPNPLLQAIEGFNLGLPEDALLTELDADVIGGNLLSQATMELPASEQKLSYSQFMMTIMPTLPSALRPDLTEGSMSLQDMTDALVESYERQAAIDVSIAKDMARFDTGWEWHVGQVQRLANSALPGDARLYENALLELTRDRDDLRDAYWNTASGSNARTFLNEAFLDTLAGEFVDSKLLESIIPGDSLTSYRDLGIAQQSLVEEQALDSKYTADSPSLTYKKELDTLYQNHLQKLSSIMQDANASDSERERAGQAYRMLRDRLPDLMSEFGRQLPVSDVTPFDYFNQSIPGVLGDGTASAAESLSLIGRDSRRADMLNRLISAGYDPDIAEAAVAQHWPSGVGGEVTGGAGVDVRGEPLISEVQKVAKNLQANRAGTQYLEAALPLHTAQQAANLPAGTPIAPPVGLGAPVGVPQTATGEHAFLPGGGLAPMSPDQMAAATQTAEQGMTGLAFTAPQTPDKLEALVSTNQDFQKRNAAYKAITGKDLLDDLKAGGVFDTTKFPANATRGDLFSQQVEDHIAEAEAGAREVETEIEDMANVSGLSWEEIQQRRKELLDSASGRTQMWGDEAYMKSTGASQGDIDKEMELKQQVDLSYQQREREAGAVFQPSGISQTIKGITTSRRQTR